MQLPRISNIFVIALIAIALPISFALTSTYPLRYWTKYQVLEASRSVARALQRADVYETEAYIPSRKLFDANLEQVVDNHGVIHCCEHRTSTSEPWTCRVNVACSPDGETTSDSSEQAAPAENLSEAPSQNLIQVLDKAGSLHCCEVRTNAIDPWKCYKGVACLPNSQPGENERNKNPGAAKEKKQPDPQPSESSPKLVKVTAPDGVSHCCEPRQSDSDPWKCHKGATCESEENSAPTNLEKVVGSDGSMHCCEPKASPHTRWKCYKGATCGIPPEIPSTESPVPQPIATTSPPNTTSAPTTTSSYNGNGHVQPATYNDNPDETQSPVLEKVTDANGIHHCCEPITTDAIERVCHRGATCGTPPIVGGGEY